MKTIIIVLGVLIFGVIAGLVYFASGISAVYPPIKSYDFDGVEYSIKQSIEEIVAGDSTLSFKMTDITGYEEPYKYYGSFSVKRGRHQYLFDIKYQTAAKFLGNDKYTELSLIRAFDESNKTGGYSKEDKNVSGMLILFEEVLIKKLIPNLDVSYDNYK
ncbi:MAG: hypothetical protein V4594_01485 [Bacteroidota bacterium]